MFSAGHILFLIISAAVITAGILYCVKKRPPLKKVLYVCLALGLLSEFIKILYLTQIVPVVEPVVENGALIYKETGSFTPYLEAEHLPFELCSYQILFIFLAIIIKDRKWLKPLHAMMYPTCIIGALMALFLTFETHDVDGIMGFLGSINIWRTFLYHSMLIVLGVYIGISGECDLRFRDFKWAVILVALLDFGSFYLNSIMSTPYYQGDTLVGVGNAVNYFSSYNNPLSIVMPDKRSWFVYLAIRFALAFTLMLLFYLPLLKKDRKDAK